MRTRTAEEEEERFAAAAERDRCRPIRPLPPGVAVVRLSRTGARVDLTFRGRDATAET
jgi:hypothetical protein